MEKLTINVPDDKSSLVKQILQELGVTTDMPAEQDTTSYKKKLSKVSHWTADDVKVFEEAKFNNLPIVTLNKKHFERIKDLNFF